MNKLVKTFLVLGITLLLVGLTVFLVGLGLNGWKINSEYEMQTFDASENASSLDLEMSAGEINVVFFDGENVQVDYPTSATRGYTVKERGGIISVEPIKRVHFSFFGWGKIPAVTVKVPRGEVLNFKLDMSAGTASVESGDFLNFSVDISAGSIGIGEISCRNLRVNMSAGKFTCAGAETPSVDIDVSAGSATVSHLIANDITVDLSAGSAVLNVDGREADYTVSVDKSAGSCNLADRRGEVAGKIIDIDLSAGSVTVNFSD